MKVNYIQIKLYILTNAYRYILSLLPKAETTTNERQSLADYSDVRNLVDHEPTLVPGISRQNC